MHRCRIVYAGVPSFLSLGLKGGHVPTFWRPMHVYTYIYICIYKHVHTCIRMCYIHVRRVYATIRSGCSVLVLEIRIIRSKAFAGSSSF